MFAYQKTKKEIIDETLNVIDIYSYYIGINIKRLPISMKSPLRGETRSSFGIFNKGKNILWKDFTLNIGGDIYTLISKMYGLTFNESIDKIYNDLVLNKQTFNNINIVNSNRIIFLQPYYYIEENIPESYWNFWKRYKVITKDILNKNAVQCVKYLYINYNLIEEYSDTNILIGYKWKYKGQLYHKIYKPLSKEKRFITDFRGASSFLIHGLNHLDKSVHYVIITKSVKDKMVLEALGYNAINIQNEGVKIPIVILNELKKYYTHIYLLYDNDYDKKENWGQIAAKNLIKEHPFLINRKIDGRYKCSDISEYIEKYSIEDTKKLLNQLFN